MDNGHVAGMFLGFLAGVYKSLKIMVVTLGVISWEAAWDTLFLGVIGGAAGLIGVEIAKKTKKIYNKLRNKWLKK